jgi:DNA-binding ferritin-like protein
MISRLVADNDKYLETLNMAFKLANQFDKQGLVNFLADRIDVHNKHAWMLRSIIT